MKRILSALLACMLAASLCISALADEEGTTTFNDYKPRALQSGETLRLGIDVSQFQGTIDWKAVADSGVEFAFIRAAFRGYGPEGRLLEDTAFRKNLAEAHANGILVGAYIYSQAVTPEEGREEARYLVNCIKEYHMDLPLVFDPEFTDNPGGGFIGRLYGANLSREEMTDICNAFCAEVELLGYESLVYANPFMLTSHMNRDQLGRLWLANHVTETSYTGSYEFWQCTATGKVPGIQNAVDLDFWFAGAEAPQPVLRFTDVPAKHWAYRDLRTAVANGWIKGYPDNTFRPSDTLTRADFVTMLSRLSGADLTAYSVSPFPDVKDTAYYCQSVAWAVDAGIISGFPDGTFRPTQNVTREQMAHIMTMYLRHIGTDTTLADNSVDASIADLNRIGSWALQDVRFCYSVGLLNGRGSGFVPDGTATRAEAATVLARLARYANPAPVEPPVVDPDYGVVLALPEIHITEQP